MRALLEGPVLRSTEVMLAMAKDSGIKVSRMAVDGGMTVNNLLMQMQADFSDAEIVRKEEKEITSIGAAIAAGLHVKFWQSTDDVKSKIKIEREFKPEMSEENRAHKLKRWSKAVDKSIGFASD